MKTRQEVEALKVAWIQAVADDVEFDLAGVAGFEEYKWELQAFQEWRKLEWEKAVAEELELYAVRLGVPGNHRLAAFVRGLEHTVYELRDRMAALENRQ